MGSGRIPLVGFGTWQVTENAADIVTSALDAGFRHIDCAKAYGNEDQVGVALKQFLANGGKREELFITSKLWNDAHRPDAVRAACQKSVQDLGCDYLDLYLIHWPNAFKPGTSDPDTEVTIQQTWAAMEALVDDGLVKQIGVSNFSVKQIEEIFSFCRIKPVCNQVELHPLNSQRQLVGTLLRKGVQCVAYSPVGGSGDRGVPLREHALIKELAEKAGKTPSQIVLKWNIQRGVPVIVKTTSPAHMKENLDVIDWKLNEQEKVAIDALNKNHRFIRPSWAEFSDPASS